MGIIDRNLIGIAGRRHVWLAVDAHKEFRSVVGTDVHPRHARLLGALAFAADFRGRRNHNCACRNAILVLRAIGRLSAKGHVPAHIGIDLRAQLLRRATGAPVEVHDELLPGITEEFHAHIKLVAGAAVVGLIDRLEGVPVAVFARHHVARQQDGSRGTVRHFALVDGRCALAADDAVVAVGLAFAARVVTAVNVKQTLLAAANDALAAGARRDAAVGQGWAGLGRIAVVGQAVAVVIDIVADFDGAGVDSLVVVIAIATLVCDIERVSCAKALAIGGWPVRVAIHVEVEQRAALGPFLVDLGVAVIVNIITNFHDARMDIGVGVVAIAGLFDPVLGGLGRAQARGIARIAKAVAVFVFVIDLAAFGACFVRLTIAVVVDVVTDLIGTGVDRRNKVITIAAFGAVANPRRGAQTRALAQAIAIEVFVGKVDRATDRAILIGLSIAIVVDSVAARFCFRGRGRAQGQPGVDTAARGGACTKLVGFATFCGYLQRGPGRQTTAIAAIWHALLCSNRLGSGQLHSFAGISRLTGPAHRAGNAAKGPVDKARGGDVGHAQVLAAI